MQIDKIILHELLAANLMPLVILIAFVGKMVDYRLVLRPLTQLMGADSGLMLAVLWHILVNHRYQLDCVGRFTVVRGPPKVP